MRKPLYLIHFLLIISTIGFSQQKSFNAPIQGIFRLKADTINADECIVRFVNGATPGFNGSWDAYKIFDINALNPLISTQIAGGVDLSINSQPVLTGQIVIPVNITANYPSTSVIYMNDVNSVLTNACVKLHDLLLDTIVDFYHGATYTNLVDTGSNIIISPRFQLLISAPTVANFGVSDTTIDYAITNGEITFTDSSCGASTIAWDFGDGSPVIQDSSVITHTFNCDGTYNVTFIATDTICGNVDSKSFMVTVNKTIVADFFASDTIVDLAFHSGNVTFTNQSVGYSQSIWNFGDGSALSNDDSPTHNFSSGNFIVTLIVEDSLCGTLDTLMFNLTVKNSTSLEESQFDQFFTVSQQGNELIINPQNIEGKAAIIQLFDVTGKLLEKISEKEISNNQSIRVKVSESMQVCVLSIHLNANSYSKKLVLR